MLLKLLTYNLNSVFDEFDNMEKTIEDSMRKIQESMKNEEKEIELESAANPGNSNFQSYRNVLLCHDLCFVPILLVFYSEWGITELKHKHFLIGSN